VVEQVREDLLVGEATGAAAGGGRWLRRYLASSSRSTPVRDRRGVTAYSVRFTAGASRYPAFGLASAEAGLRPQR
jgi:hypothetical protein